MENVVLVILLILALALIAIVLLQRSEGGGLGMGGGGGGGGVMSSRSAATALGKITWFLGAGFFVAAMTLTVISAKNSANSSVVGNGGEQSAPALPGNLTLPSGTDFGADGGASAVPDVEDLLPPAASDENLNPPAAE